MSQAPTQLHWDQVGAWYGGTVTAVALAPESAHKHVVQGLIASRSGIYRWMQPDPTGDGLAEAESSITPYSQGLTDLNVVALALTHSAANSAATAFASTATGRLYRRALDNNNSTNGAWQEVIGWAGFGVAVVLVASPAYAEDRTLFAGTPEGIYRSLDDGSSWESCNFGLQDEDVLCLACAPNFAGSELLWAGTAAGGLYRSRNSARAWRESGNALPDAAVQCMAVSPNFAGDHTLYVGMEENGIYCSHDGGEKWQPLALQGQSINCLANAGDDLLWAGSAAGLWRVTPSRSEAQRVAAADEIVLTVAANTTGEVVIGLYGRGLWLSNDARLGTDQIKWQKPPLPLHAPPVVLSTGTDLFAFDSDGIVASSSNGGVQWSDLEPPNSDLLFALAAGHSDNPLSGERATLFAVTGSGLARWRTIDEGWQELASDYFSAHTITGSVTAPRRGQEETLVATTAAGRLFLSQDSGTNWREIGGPWYGRSVLHVHFSPDDSHRLIVLTAQPDEAGHYAITLWNSDNLGEEWEGVADLNSDLPAVSVAWPLDKAERAIYLAIQHRLIKIFEAGEPPTRQIHQHFFAEGNQITALAIAPEYEQQHTLWAATTGGLFRSTDRSESWQLLANLPLDTPIVWLEAADQELKAVTLGGQVWRAKISTNEHEGSDRD